jgi:fluoride exporter
VIALMVAIGAAVGAPLRYLIDRGIQARYKPVFPWGTLLVNVTACLAIGLVTGTVTASSPPRVQAFIGTGLAGALSTLSTFSYQTLRLAEEGMRIFSRSSTFSSPWQRDCSRQRQASLSGTWRGG